MNESSVRKAVGLAAVLGLWQLLATTGVINAFLLPPPLRLVDAAYQLLMDG